MEMWLWIRKRKIPWRTGRANEEVLEVVKEEGVADGGSKIETTEIL